MIRIGTSGWVYDDWKGLFYPEDLPSEERLPFYAQHFDTVEVNYSFYHVPSRSTTEKWAEQAPQNFLFAVKGNRYLTHMKNLLEPEEPLHEFLENISALGDKLGPVLFQLPPHWNVNAERLANFAAILPPDYRYAFEFRDESWYTKQVYEILAKHDCAFCIHDHRQAPSPDTVTASFVYVRFHGTEGNYHGSYPDDALATWAEKIAGWASRGLDVYVYFNNDWEGFAIDNGKTLMEQLEETRS